jgi:arylsulfatase A-like enzyme
VGVRTRLLCTLAVGFLLSSCPSTPKEVVYDLAARTLVADRWADVDVLLFGIPAAQPALIEGFHREARVDGEPFQWSKREAALSLHFEDVVPRAAVVDLAPYEETDRQRVEVLLNETPVADLGLAEVRGRYHVPLPAEVQHRGENVVRFVFAEARSPSELDPASRDRRELAARFYSIVVGPDDDRLQDLLRRGAPRPFAVTQAEGGPTLSLVGPARVRYALRLPRAAELHFSPDLPLAARTSAGAASFRVTLETEAAPSEERELYNLVLKANEESPGDVVVPLPGEEGDLVRLGLELDAVDGSRLTWGIWRAPRVLGRGGDVLDGGARPAALDARADPLREKLKDANVVFVILDAARAREFGAYGYERDTTPEMDRIAADGVLFEKAYSPAVYTLGAMSSVWTSQYPDRHHGDVSFQSPLPLDRLTLAEMLTGQGIDSAGFVATAVPGGFNGFDRGFSEFHEVWREVGSRADAFREVLPRWIKTRGDRRFFLYVHYREPHFPYDPEPPFDTKWGPDGPIPKEARRDMSFFRAINQGQRPFSPEEQAHLVRLYDGNLAYVDREVGHLRQALEEAGLWDRTVFILAADHGEGLWEHGWIGHNVQVYEPTARIPLIIRFPSGVGPRGTRVDALVDLVDIAPTIADVFGVRDKGGADSEFQGRSLLPVMAGAPGRPMVVSRTVWERPRYALRDGRWTFVYDTANGDEELFDTADDPEETRDVAADRPLRAAYLRETLLMWVAHVFQPEASATAGPASMSRDECEALKALGYLADDQPCPGS